MVWVDHARGKFYWPVPLAVAFGATIDALSTRSSMMFRKLLAAAGCACALAGCSAAVAVADATVTVVATGVKVTAKTVGAVADAVIPDGEDDAAQSAPQD